jgi:hypothetical protein
MEHQRTWAAWLSPASLIAVLFAYIGLMLVTHI